MVGIVLVSHSRKLAEATLQLIHAMSGEEVPVVVAAGTGEDHQELGTDATEISVAITSLVANDEIVVMMDMGSAVLSAEMALDFLDDDIRGKVHLCPWSFVEGAVVGGVVAKTGGSAEEVIKEAASALKQKTEHLTTEEPPQNEDNTALTDQGEKKSVKLTVRIPHGLHARPVAQLVQLASRFQSVIQIQDLTNRKGPVSIKSITGVMTLEALYGHEVEITASGTDATEALNEITNAFNAGLGDTLIDPSNESGTNEEEVTEVPDKQHQPIGISRGIVIAPVYFPVEFSYEFPKSKIEDSEEEIEKLKTSLQVTENVLHRKATAVSAEAGKEEGNIFLAQATMLDDPALVEKAKQIIREQNIPAPEAWWHAVKDVMEQYRNMQDKNLRQRVLDLEDVARLVLIQFGINDSGKMDFSGEGIILVDDLTPGQVSSLDKEKIKGVICLGNGSTSHSAILLRSRSIPAIVQAQYFPDNLRKHKEGTLIAMNGETGEIWVNPQGEELSRIQQLKEDWDLQQEEEMRLSGEPAVTLDGKKITILANAGDAEDVRLGVANYAEGIGLLRTEFLFLDRDEAPVEQEQVDLMLEMLKPMKGLPVTVRTLDAGGDKALDYLHMPEEENPFLGIRAIRLSLRNPELFRQQLRAILRVGTDYNIRIMFPMITTMEELKKAKQALLQAHKSLEEENIPHKWPVKTGMMMEVPSAAIQAQQFAKEVDFMSIGTNDLTQYTLAADRTNSQLQLTSDNEFDPAVLQLIQNIVKAGEEMGKSVSVCGEAAASPALASALIGAGITELSMNPVSIPGMKSWIRTQSTTNL